MSGSSVSASNGEFSPLSHSAKSAAASGVMGAASIPSGAGSSVSLIRKLYYRARRSVSTLGKGAS